MAFFTYIGCCIICNRYAEGKTYASGFICNDCKEVDNEISLCSLLSGVS